MKGTSLKPIQISPLSAHEIQELHELYRRTRKAQLRTRAQIILLAGEKGMTAPEIAEIVRKTDQTVRNWLKRYDAYGIRGLSDSPRPGPPKKVTSYYAEQLIQAARSQPHDLGLPYPVWTLPRLAEYMAAMTGIRVDPETVRRYLKASRAKQLKLKTVGVESKIEDVPVMLDLRERMA